MSLFTKPLRLPRVEALDLRLPFSRDLTPIFRVWCRQGRSDAWIAHQLEVDVLEIARLRRTGTLL